jgi:hypothetical protein
VDPISVEFQNPVFNDKVEPVRLEYVPSLKFRVDPINVEFQNPVFKERVEPARVE